MIKISNFGKEPTNPGDCMFYFIFLFLLFIPSIVFSATIYVDLDIPADCSGNYSIASRNCSGSDGDAYDTIQEAITAMTAGDIIKLRGDTYQPANGICIPTSKNGSAWTAGNFNKLCSYEGEWAIIDGTNSCDNYCAVGEAKGILLGLGVYDYSTTSDIKFWKFERLELKNGRSTDNQWAAAFWGNGGPFWFRFCYIHDNYCTYSGNNPGGLKGQHWQDSIVEYCYINNNGMTTGTDNNPANIIIYADYNHADVGENGWEEDSSNQSNMNNEIRYNYIKGSSVGYKDKSLQFLTGRNPTGGHGYDDTNDEYGNRIHHNIFEDGRVYAIGAHQDFSQVYQNIISGFPRGIAVQYEPQPHMYKVCVYNNTIINPTQLAIIRYKYKSWSWESTVHWGYDYNNIIDSGESYWGWCNADSFAILPDGTEGNCGPTSHDVSNYYNTDNYFYRPDDADVFRMKGVSYTVAEFEAQELTHTPRVQYTNAYNAEDLLYEGTTGADEYRTRGAHVLEGADTIADGGVGGNHPFRATVTIPSFVGATKPDDNGWVAGLLNNLTDTGWLDDTDDGDPSWIEGSGETTTSSSSSTSSSTTTVAATATMENLGITGGMVIN